MTRIVTPEQARRIAVRAQLLDGSAAGVLGTVRHLGFLQMDPIAAVATAQHMVLWSRIGTYDPTELDSLIWEERKLFEWNAFIWPIESLPLIRAQMRERRSARGHSWGRRGDEFIEQNAAFRRYILRELERRGPLLGRELEDRSRAASRDPSAHRWWGSRYVGRMLENLHIRGEIAVAGRRNGQRMWDLAERWYPPTETISIREAQRCMDGQRFRALGVPPGEGPMDRPSRR